MRDACCFVFALACCTHDYRGSGLLVDHLYQVSGWCFQPVVCVRHTACWCAPFGHLQIAFYADTNHLDGLTGSRVFAELVIHLLQATMEDLDRRPYTDEDEAAAVAPIPQPVHYGNYESHADHCYVGTTVRDIVTYTDKFDWINEEAVRWGRKTARWGFIANQVTLLC